MDDLYDRLMKSKLGECHMHPQVYAELQRGEHQAALEGFLRSAQHGEWDVVVTTEIPADRVLFIHLPSELRMAVMVREDEMAEIERLRMELLNAQEEDELARRGFEQTSADTSLSE